MANSLDLEVYKDDERIAIHRLSVAAMVVGRDPTADVVLPDPQVSRQHVRLEAVAGGLRVVDLQSRNGTWVDRERVTEAVVALGHSFHVGPYRLRALESGLTAEDTQSFRLEPGPSIPALDVPQDGPVLDLAVLRDLVGVTDIHPLLEMILGRSAELLRAKHGFVVLARGSELSPVMVHRGQGAPRDSSFSRTVCGWALERRQPVVVPRPEATGGDPRIPSLQAGIGDTVLALPLDDGQGVLGVLYLEGDGPAFSPTTAVLGLLSELGRLGARALRAAVEREELVRVRDRWEWLSLSTDDAPDIFRAATSPAMREVTQTLRQAAREDVTILITGETGTGKEVAARAIHRLSVRKDKPFVAINCGAIPCDLVEAELFGHEKAAFTGATESRVGRVELARGGTLFLDEIGDLPAAMQVKLLRLLDTRTYERLGGRLSLRLDARVVAATHRDLREQVVKGAFREDLYYRLNVLCIKLPPLRERPQDLERLVKEVLRAANRRFQKKLYGISPSALDVLREYRWPGNVRELRNVIERAFVLESSGFITPRSLPLGTPVPTKPYRTDPGSVRRSSSPVIPLSDFLLQQEKDYVRLVLEEFQGNVTRAALALGMSRTALHRRLSQLGIRTSLRARPAQ